jgi:hypothetical protein
MLRTRKQRCQEILRLYDQGYPAADRVEAVCNAYVILGDAQVLGEDGPEYAWTVFEIIDEMYDDDPESDDAALLQRQEGAALVYLGRIR